MYSPAAVDYRRRPPHHLDGNDIDEKVRSRLHYSAAEHSAAPGSVLDELPPARNVSLAGADSPLSGEAQTFVPPKPTYESLLHGHSHALPAAPAVGGSHTPKPPAAAPAPAPPRRTAARADQDEGEAGPESTEGPRQPRPPPRKPDAAAGQAKRRAAEALATTMHDDVHVPRQQMFQQEHRARALLREDEEWVLGRLVEVGLCAKVANPGLNPKQSIRHSQLVTFTHTKSHTVPTLEPPLPPPPRYTVHFWPSRPPSVIPRWHKDGDGGAAT